MLQKLKELKCKYFGHKWCPIRPKENNAGRRAQSYICACCGKTIIIH